ncbi:MAG: cation-translocating P-type ATPase [Pseudomonadota bacterium]
MNDTPPRQTLASDIAGLSAAEAAARLAREGYNELAPPRRRGPLALVVQVVREPMFLLLVGAGAIYLLLGDVREASMLLFFVLVMVTITVVQEHRTERVLAALRDLSSPRALVIRDGRSRRIPGREVVRGDVLALSEGDRVPADACILSCNDLQADESLLTGESVPVRKRAAAGDEAPGPPGGDDRPFLYAGTLVVQGRGLARVTATGPRTEMGRIGRALERTAPESSPLQHDMRALVRRLAAVAVALSVALVLLFGVLRGDWLQAVLSGIALAMAALPEEFPVVLTVFMALGAWRISRERVLARRMEAIETLGATTVLCSDKTGTLTRNRMTVHELAAEGESFVIGEDGARDLPERFHALLEYAILASEIDPFDPMEKAFHDLGRDTLANTEHLHGDWQIVHEYSLSPELLAMSHVWRGPEGPQLTVAAKGAPEAVIDLCHMNEAAAGEAAAQAARMARAGLRVLGVARARLADARCPPRLHDIPFRFLGLVGLSDPVRPEVPEAIALCRSAGIRVAMITGDYPATAAAIGRRIGLSDRVVVTGTELDTLPDDALQARLGEAQIFARIVPEQKLRLVNAFKANGEVVAMTGDGVNDAPALRAAHIGIAMGRRGTDVAREAAALVLLEDDFASIVKTIRLGRRIFDNLRRSMSYILAVHVPIVGLALLPVVAGQPLLLFPAHIVFLELIIDPACSIAFEAEPEEQDIMARPPRAPGEPLFGGANLLASLTQGGAALAVMGLLYWLALSRGTPEGEARAMMFMALVAGNLALILANRSRPARLARATTGTNRMLWAIFCAALLALGLVVGLPVLRSLFHFDAIAPGQAALALVAGTLVLPLARAVKLAVRRRGRVGAGQPGAMQ